MLSKLLLTVYFMGFALASLNQRTENATGCNDDGCLRAVTGTRRGTDHPSSASADCASYLQTIVTPPPFTVFTTTTVAPAVTAKVKRDYSGIPAYASACSGAARYSSACSCFGISAATITAPTPTITQTVTTTTSSTTSTCTANTNTDPNNCGACGIVCPGGICENGSCSSSGCQGETCDTGFTNCNGNDSCYCFTDSKGTGFCGQNAFCDALSTCATDADCGNGSGNICAVNTCCSSQSNTQPGVCLSAQCPNPASKLMRMAKGRRTQHGMAAYK